MIKITINLLKLTVPYKGNSGFPRPIYAINPKYTRLSQQPCYSSITAIGKPVDLAVFAGVAITIPEIIRAYGEHGVRAVIVISSGFGEGKSHLSNLTSSLDKTVLEIARQYQGIYK